MDLDEILAQKSVASKEDKIIRYYKIDVKMRLYKFR